MEGFNFDDRRGSKARDRYHSRYALRMAATCSGSFGIACSNTAPAGLEVNTTSECFAAYAKPVGDALADTKIGRPKLACGENYAPSRL